MLNKIFMGGDMPQAGTAHTFALHIKTGIKKGFQQLYRFKYYKFYWKNTQ
jgi:hypothetical protein